MSIMDTYYVTKESVCPRCEGRKVIQEPIWKDYWDFAYAFKSQNGRLPSRDEDRGWWTDAGYFDWETVGQGGIPPEECECTDCEGTGVKIEKVDLMDALRDALHCGRPLAWLLPENQGELR
jgi:hypothetical protein